jgi:hypothetical protein
MRRTCVADTRSRSYAAQQIDDTSARIHPSNKGEVAVLMAGIEELLGKSYADLCCAPALRGANIPPLERIDDESYVSIHPLGISLVLADNVSVSTIQLHSEGHENYSGYSGTLPDGISFSMGRERLRALLGEPSRSGEETVLPILGKKPPWDSFHLGRLHVHVEYSPGNNSIRLVSLSAKQDG